MTINMIQNKFYLIILIIISSTVLVLSSGLSLQIVYSQSILEEKDLSLTEIFDKTKESVVQITRTIPSVVPYQINKENQTSLGSGFVYNNDGYIITNNHVIENAETVDVTFLNGSRYTANITGADPFSDLAVIKINENISRPIILPASLELANSSNQRVGDQVVAIGNPFGLEGSMTTGIISAVGRLISVEEKGFSIPNSIQTDALINPGNSGGPLLNMKGEVIGVNTAGIFPGNIGLSVPSNTVDRIVPALIEKGNYSHPWLGITSSTLTADIAKREKVNGTITGVIIDTVIRNSSADLAGLNGSIVNQYGQKKGGDIILAANGKNIVKLEDLISYLEINKSVGESVTLSILRDGDFLQKEVKLKEKPSPIQTTINNNQTKTS
jgi:S1-C subfamily serine protease